MRDSWQDEVANDLKARIKRAGIAYSEMAGRLTANRTPITTAALAKKLCHGGFSHAVFMRCLDVLGQGSHSTDHLGDSAETFARAGKPVVGTPAQSLTRASQKKRIRRGRRQRHG